MPWGGVSWVPSVDEKDKARRLLVFLADRRSLFEPYNVETDVFVTQSVLEMRKRFVSDLEVVDEKSTLGQCLKGMSAACRKFLADTRSESCVHNCRHFHMSEEGFEFFRSLGELRAFIGVQIAVLAYIYGLTIEGELTTILPPTR